MKMAEMNKINNEELDQVTGGGSGNGGGWVYGTVFGVVHYDASSCLTLRNAPDGAVQYTNSGRPMGWQNGEAIPVRPASRQGSWIQASYNGTIGWVNAKFVNY